MTITTEQRAGITILRVQGDLDANAGDDLVAAATEWLNERGDRIVIDLGGLAHLSSAGIGALVRITAQANTQEQTVALAGPTPLVAGVFAATRLDRFFTVYPSVAAAVEKLGQSDQPGREPD